jgi:hypothetical protein
MDTRKFLLLLAAGLIAVGLLLNLSAKQTDAEAFTAAFTAAMDADSSGDSVNPWEINRVARLEDSAAAKRLGSRVIMVAGIIIGVAAMFAGRSSPPTRTCPHCAEDVLAEAKVCKHCGRDLDGASP